MTSTAKMTARTVSRRKFLARAAAVAATVSVASSSLPAADPQPGAAESGPDWSKIRGFNYQPSFGRNGIEIWVDNFDASVVERELGLGRRYFPGMNTVRLWLSHDAYIKAPQKFSDNFEAILKACQKLNIKAVPTLFNNWHSVPDFGGISTEMIGYWFRDFGKNGEAPNYIFRPYLEATFKNHATDPRILAWDLCNEPFNNGGEVFLPWLTHTYHLGKALGAKQPIAVSSQSVSPQIEPISDVLMIHPYYAANIDWGPVQDFARKCGKGLLATECCWGSLDDAQRAVIIRSDLGTLAKQKIGFLGHALHESYVADLHRPQYGPVSSAEYMAFINMDGTLRAGHDAFNDY